MAERKGFEPLVPCGITGFQDQLLKPLGHLSILGYINDILSLFCIPVKIAIQKSPIYPMRKSMNPTVLMAKLANIWVIQEV